MAVKFGALTPALTSAQFEAADRSRSRKRRRHRRLPIPFANLVDRCLHPEPSRRPTASDLSAGFARFV